ncbi:MAG: ATP-binding cassette domain-containing protein, partial [Candidatus Omnitrophica bacterium]|nr:ATP-binding cassette domain-containing protein [Candidatus Omnitrophota bacterium]
MLIELRDIHKDFNIEKGLFKQEAGLVRALDGVSLSLEQFQSLGIVGESGCGKTTLAKVMLKLIPATSGEVIFDQRRISNFRKDVQIIFQNPYNSLNPKMRVGEIISEPLHVHRIIPAGKRV